MTYQEFLKKLSETPNDWTLDATEFIRRKGHQFADIKKPEICPVCAVANLIVGEQMYYNDYIGAARAIKLDESTAREIAEAADNDTLNEEFDYNDHEIRIRTDLLNATNIL